jgi:aldehyde dehydrogenase (NAD+)
MGPKSVSKSSKSASNSTNAHGNNVQLQEQYNVLLTSFSSGVSLDISWRISQLQGIKQLLKDHESEIAHALHHDLGRSEFESIALELFPVYIEIEDCIANVWKWSQPDLCGAPLGMMPATSEIRKEPMGLSLIIGAFNYPINLTMVPLCGAISAGCCVLLKPSEMSTQCEKLIFNAIMSGKYVDTNCIQVCTGGVEETTFLLNELKWDKIFFTGSPRVGKIVMKAASQNLTSVTLVSSSIRLSLSNFKKE